MTLSPSHIPPDFLHALPVVQMFDRLADTVFFVKDEVCRYRVVNDTLVSRCRLRHKDQLIGKMPSQVLGPTLGAGYEAQDRTVLETGTRILDRLELHVYANRTIGWCVTHKFPLYNGDGAVIGVAGISKDLQAPEVAHEDFARLKTVISHVGDNLANPPGVRELSTLAAMTPDQLDRRVQRIFGLTAGQWILKQRLDHARHQLVGTDKSVAEIALDSGYQDQSAFTRQFRRTTGLTPSRFRSLYRPDI